MIVTDAVPPSPPARPLLRALPGIVLLVLGWTCTATPTPSEEAPPQDFEDAHVTCEELEARDGSEYVVVSGHFEEVPEERRVRVVCDDGGSVIVNGNVRVSGNPGFIRLRWRGDDPALWVHDTCMRCEGMPPRHHVPTMYRVLWTMRILAMGLMALGAWLFVAGWARRPFDLFEDLDLRRRLRAAVTVAGLDAGSLLVDGVPRAEPRLGVTNGELAGQPEGPSQLVVAAARGYRDSAAAGAHLVGPAKLLGQRVRAGERVPVLHGDHVELPGHPPFEVSFREPGITGRFFGRDPSAIEIVGRFPIAHAKRKVLGVVCVIAVGGVVSLWDAPWGFLVGLLPLVVGLGLAFALPRQLMKKVVTRIDLEALGRVELVAQGRVTAIVLDGRTLGYVPANSSPLSQALRRELERLIAHSRAT